MTKFKVADDQIKPIFDALDTSNNDEIHYTEFLAAMVSTRIAMHDDLLAQTFQRFDVDNSGFITPDNLRVVLGESFSGAEIENLMAEGDLTKDGRISYDEFITYLKGDSTSELITEAAGRIVDTELSKNDTKPAAVGTLAWGKGKGEGLRAMSGMSAESNSSHVVKPLATQETCTSTTPLANDVQPPPSKATTSRACILL